MDRVFAALASRARRRMLDIVRQRSGCTIADLAARFRMSAVGVLKHVRVLERSRLVISRREGRVRRLYFNTVPIQLIHDRWTDHYSAFWAERVSDLKATLETELSRKAVRSA